MQTISVINLLRSTRAVASALLADSGLPGEDIPWAARLACAQPGVWQTCLGCRSSLLTAPFVGLAALLIWLEDQGPIFTARRSGWMGRPFMVLKPRTMRVQAEDAQMLWTQPGDLRITTVGQCSSSAS